LIGRQEITETGGKSGKCKRMDRKLGIEGLKKRRTEGRGICSKDFKGAAKKIRGHTGRRGNVNGLVDQDFGEERGLRRRFEFKGERRIGKESEIERTSDENIASGVDFDVVKTVTAKLGRSSKTVEEKCGLK
jgi:hypothetical protein